MILKYWARSSQLGSNLPVNELFGYSIYKTELKRLNKKIPYVTVVEDLKKRDWHSRLENTGTSVSKGICTQVNKAKGQTYRCNLLENK